MIELTKAQAREWKSAHRRVGSAAYEVFTAPDGTEYVKCAQGEAADVTYKSAVKGIPVLQLRRADASSRVRVATRRDRRAQRELRVRRLA